MMLSTAPMPASQRGKKPGPGPNSSMSGSETDCQTVAQKIARNTKLATIQPRFTPEPSQRCYDCYSTING